MSDDPMTPEQAQDFHGLSKQLIAAKKAKKAADAEVTRIEKLIIEKFAAPESGQATYKSEQYKIVVKGVMNRKVDIKAIEEMELPYPPLKPGKNELDADGMAWLLKNHPNDYEKVITAITTKPGKTSVTITENI